MQTAFRLLQLAAVSIATVALFAAAAFIPEGEPAAAPLRRRLPYVRAVLGLVALVALVGLTACGGGDPEDDSATSQDTAQPSAKMGAPKPPCTTSPEVCK